MQFVSKFEVPTGVGEAWHLLGDIPRIAPCLPGATVRPLSDDVYGGDVNIKVGPIRVGYSGQATVVRRDPTEHVMVLDAHGKEGNGKGSASATITLQLRESGAHATLAEVTTDLAITGRLAQFGRSAMADVSQRLMEQFAANLAVLTSSVGDAGSGTVSAPAPPSKENVNASVPTAPNELDAMTLALPMLKRAAGPALALVAGLTIGVLIGRRRTQAMTSTQAWSPRPDRPWPGCLH